MPTISECPTCGYPVAASFEGQSAVCANCGEHLISQGVTIPTPLFAGSLGFVFGVLIGPAILAASNWGRTYLEKKARGG